MGSLLIEVEEVGEVDGDVDDAFAVASGPVRHWWRVAIDWHGSGSDADLHRYDGRATTTNRTAARAGEKSMQLSAR
jgi:hypothetical protein